MGRLPGLWEQGQSTVGWNRRWEIGFPKRQGGHVMARRFFALGVVGLLLTGCVSRDQYEAVKLERNSYAEQLGTAQASSAADRAAAEAWRSQQERLISAGDDKEKALALATKANAEAAARNRELQGKSEA